MEELKRFIATTKSGEKITYTGTQQLTDAELEDLLKKTESTCSHD